MTSVLVPDAFRPIWNISVGSRETHLALTLIVWSFIWLWRYQREDYTAVQDLWLLTLCELWISSAAGALSLGENDGLRTLLRLHIALCACTLITIYFGRHLKQHEVPPRSAKADATSTDWVKPLIYPARTTHTRFIPRKHSFSYSYLLVGVPVGLRDTVNGILSVDCRTKFPILSIDAADYLDRKSGELGLRTKLDNFLKEQGVESNDYPNVYLVTAPRVFGYSFNPASFWYLYTAEGALGAMVVEVNNTFDERRLYFLQREISEDTQNHPSFTSKWDKDFHVSPFNSREGIYSLLAHDPLSAKQTTEQELSNTITLSTSEGRPKIVARIFSSGSPIDPANLGSFGVLRLLFNFGWIGFLTFPRILAEARKLYFSKSLALWYRPEVKQTSIARRSTSAERDLEKFFKLYLQYVVESSTEPLCLHYKSSPDIGKGDLQKFTSSAGDAAQAPVVEMQVLSSAFYNRFVHYAHASEAFDNECFWAKDENRTVYVSRPDLIARLFHRDPSAPSPQRKSGVQCSLSQKIDCMRWEALRRLRCPPGPPSYPSTTTSQHSQQDIRHFSLSMMDAFVIQHCPDAWRYRRRLSQLFIAQRIVSGYSPVLGILDQLLRFLLTTAGLGLALQLIISRDAKGSGLWAGALLIQILLSSLAHIWGLAKGIKSRRGTW